MITLNLGVSHLVESHIRASSGSCADGPDRRNGGCWKQAHLKGLTLKILKHPAHFLARLTRLHTPFLPGEHRTTDCGHQPSNALCCHLGGPPTLFVRSRFFSLKGEVQCRGPLQGLGYPPHHDSINPGEFS